MSIHLQAVLCCCLASLASGLRRKSAAEGQQKYSKSNDHIICPVLAALHRAGDLKTDNNGNMELQQLYDGLHEGLGIRSFPANFQAFGIVKYDKSQKGIEETTNACKPPGGCFLKRFVLDDVNSDTLRYLNIFEMHGKQAIEHGISTGIRGGDTNMPPNAIDCRGQYPCRKRFDQFFGGVVSNGRFYMEDIMAVVCKARKYGDRNGEYAYAPSKTVSIFEGWNFSFTPVPGREWQMRGAMSATLVAFGRTDGKGELYLTMDDLKALFLDGRYPDGWKPRTHGCMLLGCELSALTRFNLDVPCDVDYEEPFWQGTGCQVYTGRTCGVLSDCNAGETCVGRKCLCSRGSNLRTMCFSGGSCKEQRSGASSWFGGRSRIFPEVDTPGNP